MFALGALLTAAPATADDRSVASAFRADEAKFNALQRTIDRAHARWVRRQAKRPEPLLRAFGKVSRLQRSRRENVRAEEASSELGAEARRRLVKSLGIYLQSAASAVRYVRLSSRGAALLANGDQGAARKAFSIGSQALRKSAKRDRAWKREDRAARDLLRDALEQPEPAPVTAAR